MARIRSVKPEFWTDEKIMDLTLAARLLFIGIWNFCDDYGRLPYSAKSIKALVLPGDDIGFAEVDLMLKRLSALGLILVYSVKDREYLEVTNWHKHQKIDRPTAKYPPPFVETSTSPRQAVVEPSPPDVEGKRKGREVESEADAKARAINSDLRVAVVKAFEAASSPNLPDTSRVGLWLSQGYDPAIILACVTDCIRKKPSIASLNYFDTPIREAHASKAPHREEVPTTDDLQVDWDKQVGQFAKGFPWSTRWYGPEPGHLGCRVPAEMLEKHGYLTEGAENLTAN